LILERKTLFIGTIKAYKYEAMTTEMLTLLLILLGLAMIFGGARGLRLFLAPFRWMIKVGFILVIFLVIGVILLPTLSDMSKRFSGISLPFISRKSERVQSRQPEATGGGATRETNRLVGFYPLRQTDPSLYEPQEMSEWTYSGEPSRNLGQIACLATVYLMIERSRIQPNAKITPDWFNSEGYVYKKSYVQNEREYKEKTVLEELQAGRPVILWGTGGGQPTHFLLATGWTKESGELLALLALDPWTGREKILPIQNGYPNLPQWPGHQIRKIRSINP
jgi:hypothetical protein